jgi:hypothetical protein
MQESDNNDTGKKRQFGEKWRRGDFPEWEEVKLENVSASLNNNQPIYLC